MEFTKATKAQSYARLALFGPSGAGKTFSGLRIACGLGKPIALIDTERGSASKYSDRFDFDVLDLPKKDILTYVEAIKDAAAGGYATLIIDSLSHAWHDLLLEVEKLAQAKYRGNTWSAWAEGTPKQKLLVEAILDYPGHVIATMRSKTEWVHETNSNGKQAPKRVGMSPEQGKGIEYEFDLLMELTTEHIGTVIKDRSGRFQDKIIDKPGEGFGAELAEWLSEGEIPPPAPRTVHAGGLATDDECRTLADLKARAAEVGAPQGGIDAALASVTGKKRAELTSDEVNQAIELMEMLVPKRTRAEEVAGG